MRIEVVDPSGCGLGLAIGLVELGHRVAYRGAASWQQPGGGDARRACRELVARHFGPGPRHDPGSDLLVLVDVFADHLHALTNGHVTAVPADGFDPLADGGGPLVYAERLRWYCERVVQAPRVAIVDLADRASPREVGFAALPHATLFARECVAGGDGAWRPFPFLYNQVVLWLERLQPRTSWWVAPSARVPAFDWAFCGTIDHARYGERRRLALAELAQRWPHLRGVVQLDVPFVEVVRTLQAVRFGVDLPGAGELCFRLHECLALGTPVVRPFRAGIAVPEGLRPVLTDDPARLASLAADEVRALYEAHYAPRAAAQWLLAGVQGQATGGQAVLWPYTQSAETLRIR